MNQRKRIERFPAGTVSPPPSKSHSHRAVICAALAAADAPAGEESVIENFALSDDISATLGGVAALGFRWELEDGVLRVPAGRGPLEPAIDCAESGSTLRFLLPLAALRKERTAFTGRGRLMERPMEVYERVFAASGAEFRRGGGKISVRGPLRGGVFRLPGDVSSQFVSGLLFALPLLEEDSEIRLTSPLQSRQYVDLTVDVLRRFGVTVEQPEPDLYRVPGGQRYRPAHYRVEADYSQAAFFLCAAALGRDVRCSGLDPGSLQGDRAILDVLRQAGVEIVIEGGTVTARARRLSAVTVDARQIPDLVPPIAALCCFCEGTSRIVGAERLRLKESDRLRALATELRALGARIEEGEDSLTITGSPELAGGTADAHGDHRIAMAAAVAAIRCRGPVELTGWESVAKSYPDFWTDFEREAD